MARRRRTPDPHEVIDLVLLATSLLAVAASVVLALAWWFFIR